MSFGCFVLRRYSPRVTGNKLGSNDQNGALVMRTEAREERGVRIECSAEWEGGWGKRELLAEVVTASASCLVWGHPIFAAWWHCGTKSLIDTIIYAQKLN